MKEEYDVKRILNKSKRPVMTLGDRKTIKSIIISERRCNFAHKLIF